MAPIIQHYTLKNLANVEIIEFDNSSVEAMEDIRDWLIGNLPSEFEITLTVTMGGMLQWNGPGVMWAVVRPGEFLVKDGNGKVFKITRETRDAFFDLTVE